MEAKVMEADCQLAVRNFLGPSDIVLEGYKVKSMSGPNAGFMGRHCKLTASVRVAEDSRDVHMFVKLPPATESHRKFVIDSKLFHREYVAYTSLAPLLNLALPEGMTLPFARCLLGRDTVNPEIIPEPGSAEEEIIILEDVSSRGYEFLEGFPALDLAHCSVVVKSLARLHAASILFEGRVRDSLDLRGPLPFLDDIWKPGIDRGYAYNCSRSMVSSCARLWPDRFDGRREEEAMASMEKAWDLILQLDTAFPQHTKVICHGDSWTNNILFSYEESSGSKLPTDCLFVDLQIVQYAPPVTDILFLLHVGTDEKFRARHARDLLELYHATLGEIVGFDVLEGCLPFTSLLQSYADLRIVGLVISAAYLPIILEEIDDSLKVARRSEEPLDIDEAILRDRGERIALNCRVSKAYGERISECFRECLEGLGLW